MACKENQFSRAFVTIMTPKIIDGGNGRALTDGDREWTQKEKERHETTDFRRLYIKAQLRVSGGTPLIKKGTSSKQIGITAISFPSLA